MPGSSTVEGTAQVARAFDELASKASDASTIAQEIAAIGVDAAQAAAPSRTGELVSSIGAEVGQNGADLGSEVGYAPFAEFGTVYMPGARFMAAGYNAMAERAEAIADQWMSGVLADVDRMA
jgi:HK97 gp10 family phage protein